MPEMDDALIKQVIAKYGPTLDLVNRPQEFIEILRTAKFEDPDGGMNPCAGVPPAPPPPPPGPTSFQIEEMQYMEVMKEVFALSKAVNQNTKELKAIRKRLE